MTAPLRGRCRVRPDTIFTRAHVESVLPCGWSGFVIRARAGVPAGELAAGGRVGGGRPGELPAGVLPVGWLGNQLASCNLVWSH